MPISSIVSLPKIFILLELYKNIIFFSKTEIGTSKLCQNKIAASLKVLWTPIVILTCEPTVVIKFNEIV